MASVNVPVTVSLPFGRVEDMLAKVDAALSRYFNLHVALSGGWGGETGEHREVISAHVVAVLLGWDSAADRETPLLDDQRAKRKFLAAMEGMFGS